MKVRGTAAVIQQAFNVEIHGYNLNGASYRSNTGDPSIGDSSGAHVAAITGLDDYGFEPNVALPVSREGRPEQPKPLALSPDGVFFEGQCFRSVETDIFTGGGTTATYTGNRYGADITNLTLGHLPPCGY